LPAAALGTEDTVWVEVEVEVAEVLLLEGEEKTVVVVPVVVEEGVTVTTVEATEDGELTTMVLTGTKESLVTVVWAAARPAAPRAARMVEERIFACLT
jgi:hypothetical protein